MERELMEDVVEEGESSTPLPSVVHRYGMGFWLTFVMTALLFGLPVFFLGRVTYPVLVGYLALGPFVFLVALPWLWVPAVAIMWTTINIAIALVTEFQHTGPGSPLADLVEAALRPAGKYYRVLFGQPRPLLWGVLLGWGLAGG